MFSIFFYSGELVLNYKTFKTTSNSIYGIVEDETTTGAILFSTWYAIVRLYPNGTKEVVVGEEGSAGYVTVRGIVKGVLYNK